MRESLFLLAWGLITHTCLAQGPPADTARIQLLLKESRRCLDKPGNDKRDLDSSSRFAARAMALSQQLRYLPGEQDANLLTGCIAIHQGQWSMAYATGHRLDTSRHTYLLMEMIFSGADSLQVTPARDRTVRCVDSLIMLLPGLRTPINARDAGNCLGWFCHLITDPPRGQKILSDAFRQIRRLADGLLETTYLFQLFMWLNNEKEYTSLLLSFMDQLADDDEKWLPKRSSDEQIQAIRIFSEAGNQYIQSNSPFACDTIESLAMRVTQRLHHHYVLPWCILAAHRLAQGKTQEALALTLDAVRVSETPNGPFNGFGYEYAATFYFRMGDLEKGLFYFDKCISLLKKDPSLIYYPGALFMHAVRAYLQQHRPAEAYQLLGMIGPLKIPMDPSDSAQIESAIADTWYALGRNDSAETYYLKSLDHYRGNRYNKYMRTTGLAAFYAGTGQYDRAKPLLDLLTADSNRPFVRFTDAETNWRLRYRVDSARHNFPQAVVDLLKYQFYHDSLVNDNKNKQLAEINVQYETDKKNQHIADLEKQTTLQTRLQRSSLRQDRIVRNSLIAGATLLALYSAILFSRWRTRRRMSLRLEKLSSRQQKLLAEKEKLLGEKEWLLREIHHRVKNNLQIIISLLEMQAGELKDEIAISAFEEIGARVHTISLVHKRLYQEGQDMASINMREYIGELAGFFQEGFRTQSSQGESDMISMSVKSCT